MRQFRRGVEQSSREALDRVLSFPHDWEPRPKQAELLAAIDAGCSRACMVVHRRFGKTVLMWVALIRRALTRVGLHLYIGPTYSQVKAIIWDGVDHRGRRLLDYIPRELIAGISENELQITLVNGSIIQLGSAENEDRYRGLNPVTVVCDEYSVWSSGAVWDVLQPALAENRGAAYFAFTPMGEGHGLALYAAAMQAPDWFTRRWTIAETRRDGPGEDGAPIISLADVEQMRRDGTPESAIRRDLFCSFETPVAGAIYAVELERMLVENRIAAVPWHAHLPVETAWDLGARGNNAVVLFQRHGAGRLHVVEALRSGEEGLPGLVREVLRRPYTFAGHHVPPDVRQTERGTNERLIVQLAQQGLRPIREVKNPGVEAGIYAARMLLSRTWIDGVKAAALVTSLRAYRQDEKGQPVKDGVHDHMCDAWRYAAIAKEIRSFEDKHAEYLRRYPTGQRALGASGTYDIFTPNHGTLPMRRRA
jgi:hypothetical protein